MKLGELVENIEVEDIPKIMAEVRQQFRETIEEELNENAIFKAKVGGSGRITIPTAEREALDIEEGNLVRVIVKPLNKKDESE